jgi:hypothetical protein
MQVLGLISTASIDALEIVLACGDVTGRYSIGCAKWVICGEYVGKLL